MSGGGCCCGCGNWLRCRGTVAKQRVMCKQILGRNCWEQPSRQSLRVYFRILSLNYPPKREHHSYANSTWLHLITQAHTNFCVISICICLYPSDKNMRSCYVTCIYLIKSKAEYLLNLFISYSFLYLLTASSFLSHFFIH